MKQIQPFQKHWLQLTSIVVCRLKLTSQLLGYGRSQLLWYEYTRCSETNTFTQRTSEKVNTEIEEWVVRVIQGMYSNDRGCVRVNGLYSE